MKMMCPVSYTHLVNLMNGTIKVDSTLHKGTKITVTIYLELQKKEKEQEMCIRDRDNASMEQLIQSIVRLFDRFVVCDLENDRYKS